MILCLHAFKHLSDSTILTLLNCNQNTSKIRFLQMIHVKYIITLWPSILAHLIWWISKFGCMRVFNLPFQVEKPSLRRSLGRCEIYKSELSLPIFFHTCLHCIYNWQIHAYAHMVYASFYRKHCIWIGLSCWHFHFTQKSR